MFLAGGMSGGPGSNSPECQLGGRVPPSYNNENRCNSPDSLTLSNTSDLSDTSNSDFIDLMLLLFLHSREDVEQTVGCAYRVALADVDHAVERVGDYGHR